MDGIKGTVKCEFSQIADMLRQLPDKFIKSDVTRVMKDEWSRVAEDAKRRVPVRTGRLRDMIIQKNGFNKRDGVCFSVVGLRKISGRERRRIKEKQFQRSLGYKVKTEQAEYDAYYGVFVEFGAPANHQPPHPFLRTAYDENFRKVLEDSTTEWKERLEERLGKLRTAPKKEI